MTDWLSNACRAGQRRCRLKTASQRPALQQLQCMCWRSRGPMRPGPPGPTATLPLSGVHPAASGWQMQIQANIDMHTQLLPGSHCNWPIVMAERLNTQKAWCPRIACSSPVTSG